MSVEAMAIALHHSRARGTARLVLVGIANHDGDGGAWPAVSTLAKYAGVDVRNARKALRRLEELEEIRTYPNAGGLNRTAEHERPNLYEFKLTCPPSCDGTRQHRTRGAGHPQQLPTFVTPGEAVADPRTVASGGDGSVPGGGDGSVPRTVLLTPPAKTPSIARPGERARARCAGTGRPCRYNPRLGYCPDCYEVAA